MLNPGLWAKIQNFNLDQVDADFPFSERLARDNGWSPDYSRAVVKEYKKFMYLICVTGHACTPSDQVDQVWHLHLVYTRSYWDDFCGGVLGRSIHHGPTKGGTQERRKYRDLYKQTLESYVSEFGQAPPPSIWPASGIRFSEINFKRVNADRYWVIPKSWFKPGLLTAGLAAVVFTGCKYADMIEKNGTFFIIGAIALFYIGAAVFKKMRKKKRRGLSRKGRSSSSVASGCSDDVDYIGDDSGCNGCGGD